MRLKTKWILGVTFACMAALGGILALTFTASHNAARESANQFAAALVDPAAPQPDLVHGVRRHFGRVTSARVIDTRSEQYRTRHGSRSHYVSDLLLQTPKGPVVVEAQFGSMGFFRRDVSAVHELVPSEVPDDALSDAEFVALAKAFERRGGRPADDTAFDRANERARDALEALREAREVREIRETATPTPLERSAKRMMRCVKRAKGDVAKLTACAS